MGIVLGVGGLGVGGLGAGGLGPGGPMGPGGPLGPRASPRRLLAVLAVIGLAVLGVIALSQAAQQALRAITAAAPVGSLPDAVLVGARGPACVRFVFAVDESGSMSGFAPARDAAFSQILDFARSGALRADDEIQVIDFAAVAAERLPVTRVGELTAGRPAAVPVQDGRDTNLAPVLRLVGRAPRSTCDVALVLLSDAQLADLPATDAVARAELRSAAIHDLVLLVPGDAVRVPPMWGQAFPHAGEARFDGHDTDQTAIAFGETVAQLTGQELVARR